MTVSASIVKPLIQERNEIMIYIYIYTKHTHTHKDIPVDRISSIHLYTYIIS